MYSPLISTVYGQVYWTVMDAVDLDEALVKRFEGKTMVRRRGGENTPSL